MRILPFIITAAIFSGCATKVVNVCDAEYLKCKEECAAKYEDSPFKHSICNTKCKTIQIGCKTKEKTKEFFN